MSPSARSMKHLRDEGWVVDIVERWIGGHIKVRKDLFGMFDLIAIKDKAVIVIQVTSGSNVAARVKKINASEHIEAVRKTPLKPLVHGWRKNSKGRWVLREVEV